MIKLIIVFFVLLIIYQIPAVKGLLGETSVRVFLNRLEKDKYFLLNDIMLHKADGKTTQIDHIVVSPYGIFVIETKNYKGWITGNENSHNWNQTIFKRKEKFYNPVKQNQGHINALKDLLSGEDNLPIISIISFSTRVDLKVKVPSYVAEVIYTPQINKTIKKYKKEFISVEHAKRIFTKILSANNDDKVSRKEHVRSIKNDVRERNNKINNNICPRCGGELITRKGKYGDFIGCTNYPKCRFILKSNK